MNRSLVLPLLTSPATMFTAAFVSLALILISRPATVNAVSGVNTFNDVRYGLLPSLSKTHVLIQTVFSTALRQVSLVPVSSPSGFVCQNLLHAL